MIVHAIFLLKNWIDEDHRGEFDIIIQMRAPESTPYMYKNLWRYWC